MSLGERGTASLACQGTCSSTITKLQIMRNRNNFQPFNEILIDSNYFVGWKSPLPQNRGTTERKASVDTLK